MNNLLVLVALPAVHANGYVPRGALESAARANITAVVESTSACLTLRSAHVEFEQAILPRERKKEAKRKREKAVSSIV